MSVIGNYLIEEEVKKVKERVKELNRRKQSIMLCSYFRGRGSV